MKIAIAMSTAFLMMLAAFPAAADDGSHVAAAGTKSGTIGFAVEATADAAKSEAMKECQGADTGDCTVLLSGSDMCISLARSADRKSYGLGGGASRESSQTEAMKECAIDGATGCNIHDTYCGPSSIN
ncbi:DUF4189 domain-containing protein [Amorphus orientalis]|uniref:DUF4189 domain-containing protein n=1 Tax=Amorphus orientalis TaxID=649198 RepID=A0AAE4ATE0_9HYPH|nr:DUF4189 domain-containing protein [Amorphus orientalis]MDQ0317186.1 hypothetical protein [Amorphus orientalis]